jgi:hypothetical protein
MTDDYVEFLANEQFSNWMMSNQDAFPGITLKDEMCLYKSWKEDNSFEQTKEFLYLKYGQLHAIKFDRAKRDELFNEFLYEQGFYISELSELVVVNLYYGWILNVDMSEWFHKLHSERYNSIPEFKKIPVLQADCNTIGCEKVEECIIS